jgi:hypothetical protein
MIKNIPPDIFTKYIYRNDNFILVEDPKHSIEMFHYTIWCVTDIQNISFIKKEDIIKLKGFIEKIKEMNLFDINKTKTYFTYPPTHNRLHLHIVPEYYISYRPLEELYHFNEIEDIYENIQKINCVNRQKTNSISLQLKYKIGLIYLKNIKNINKINNIKNKSNIDCIIVIRKIIKNEFIENLINNYKIINYHIYIKHIFKYKKLINFDYYFEI